MFADGNVGSSGVETDSVVILSGGLIKTGRGDHVGHTDSGFLAYWECYCRQCFFVYTALGSARVCMDTRVLPCRE